MALIDEIKTRIPIQRLIELTNPDDTTATAVNDTTLGKGVSDTENIFKAEVGVAFDLTNAIHLAYIIEGVEIILMKWIGRETATVKDKDESWHRKLDVLRRTIGANARPTPLTDSEMTPTTDKRGVAVVTVRPDFDRARFDRLRPNPPSSGGRSIGERE